MLSERFTIGPTTLRMALSSMSRVASLPGTHMQPTGRVLETEVKEMPEMTEDEKAQRLLFYKRQARAQWEGRDAALRSFSKPFFILNRIGLYVSVVLAPIIALAIVLLGVADHHYLGVFAFILVAALAIPILRLIRRGDVQPTKQSDWKPQMLALLGYVLWWLLWVGVCVGSIANQMRSS